MATFPSPFVIAKSESMASTILIKISSCQRMHLSVLQLTLGFRDPTNRKKGYTDRQIRNFQFTSNTA